MKAWKPATPAVIVNCLSRCGINEVSLQEVEEDDDSCEQLKILVNEIDYAVEVDEYLNDEI